MEGVLFALRVKKNLATPSTVLFSVKEATAKTVEAREADELARAKVAAHAYCDANPGFRYIAVERAVAFDESYAARRAKDDDEEVPKRRVPPAAGAPAQEDKR